MVDRVKNPSKGAFGIEDTLEMGVGDTQLLKDLMSPETSTGDPDKLEPIIEEVDEKKEEKKKDVTDEEKDAVPSGNDALINFLEGDEEGEADAEEKVEVKVKKEEEVAEEEPSDTEQSQFTSLAKDLFKLGVFTAEEEDEPEINTPEEFLEKFNEEKQKGAMNVLNNFISQFGEDYQRAFDAIYVKGADPKEYFSAYNDVVDFSEMDIKDENNQVTVVKRMLADQGFDPSDILDEIEKLKNYGDLEDKAAKYHKVLIKKDVERLKDMEEKAELQQQQRVAIRNQYIQNVQTVLQNKVKDKEFDGIPINPNLAAELQDFLLVDKYKTASGETLTDFDRTILELKKPENHEKKVKIALIIKLLEKDPTLSTIQKSGISKKSTALFGEVVRQVQKKTGIQNKQVQKQQNSWFR